LKVHLAVHHIYTGHELFGLIDTDEVIEITSDKEKRTEILKRTMDKLKGTMFYLDHFFRER